MTSNRSSGRSDIARDFQLYGFTVLRQLFSSEEVGDMREHLASYMERVDTLPERAVIRAPNSTSDIISLSKLDRFDPFFRRVRDDDRLKQWAHLLLRTEMEPVHVNLLAKPRGLPATRPHQDAYIFSMWPSESIMFWVALDPADEDNGCLRYVPGTHWHGYRPHDLSAPVHRMLDYSNRDRDHEVPVPVAAGDVVAHHSFTVHLSGPNRTDRSRRALAIPFVRSDAQQLSRDEWLSLHESPHSCHCVVGRSSSSDGVPDIA